MLKTKLDSCCQNCLFAPFCSAEDAPATLSAVVKQYRFLKRNEVLCAPKTPFRNLYVVRRGALKSYQTEADGHELIRGFYFSGEVFGYEAISSNQYLFSTVAITDTIVCQIPYDQLLDYLYTQPKLQKHLIFLLSKQLNIGHYLASTTAEQKLAAFLVDLASRLHVNDKHLQLPMSRQDIGNYLRLTGETISRIFSKFQRHKIISTHNKKVQFLRYDALKHIAGSTV